MTTTLLRRLPGFEFESRVPVADELPRMDVAVFAGFASRGPVHVPVPVEDPAAFEAIFGADAPLAWDAEKGKDVYAQLAPAVRMFFANGGRRCWIIRLAAEAESNRFPVPGMLAVNPDDREITPLVLAARSSGSWSDELAVSATLTVQRVGVRHVDLGAKTLELRSASSGVVEAGDLLRLAWRDAGVEMYVSVTSVGDDVVTWSDEARFASARTVAVTTGRGRLSTTDVDVRLVTTVSSPPNPEVTTLEISAERLPRAGEVIVARIGTDVLTMAIDEIVREVRPPGRTDATYTVRGRGLWLGANPPTSPPTTPSVEKVTVDLLARGATEEVTDARRAGNLGLAPSSQRNIGLLPTDETAYANVESDEMQRWRDVIEPRFPLAGVGGARFILPIGVRGIPDRYFGAEHANRDALVRDGLASFNESIFRDPDLGDSLANTLLADAEFVRFMASVPRAQLSGVHAALPIEEASIIAVPDAIHRGWKQIEPEAPLPPEPEPPSPPDPCRKGDFFDCPPERTMPLATPVVAANESLEQRGWRLRTAREYDPRVLVAAHRWIVRICAARRDLTAVLSVPEHYREDDVAAHARLLRSNAPDADGVGFVSLYHGWLFTRDERRGIRTASPDGAACGLIARRANERGAWIAPANELLRGIVALERPAPPSRWQELQNLQINVVRQLPRGFTVMNTDTLAFDDDVRPINVRRLLILLRRIVVQRGATYVFEPNDDRFRRMLQRGFEATLGDLFRRGAFAGDTAANAFQVVTGDALNTPTSVDQGRFIVELRVAPSRPMTFLTIRLVQVGERVTVTGA